MHETYMNVMHQYIFEQKLMILHTSSFGQPPIVLKSPTLDWFNYSKKVSKISSFFDPQKEVLHDNHMTEFSFLGWSVPLTGGTGCKFMSKLSTNIQIKLKTADTTKSSRLDYGLPCVSTNGTVR